LFVGTEWMKKIVAHGADYRVEKVVDVAREQSYKKDTNEGTNYKVFPS